MFLAKMPPVMPRPRRISNRYTRSHNDIAGSFQYSLRRKGLLLTLEGSLDVERPHRDGGHHQVGERQRKHEFPREPKELVVPEARQRPPHPNLEAAYQQHLHQEYEELDQHDDAMRERHDVI